MRYRNLFLIFLSLIFFLILPGYPLQFLSLTLFFLLLFSFLYSWFSMRLLKITRTVTVIRAHIHEEVTISIKIENSSFFPLHNLFVKDNPGFFKLPVDNGKLLNLPPRGKEKFSYTARGYNRGEFSIGPVMCKASDPFGFFPWHKEAGLRTQVIIYPRVFALNPAEREGLPGGSIKVSNPMYEDVTQYRAIREYVPGDDLKRVNWKISARMGKLHTMEYLPALDYTAVILLNLTEADYPVRLRFSYMERAIETAASLAHYVLNLRQGVSLISSGHLGGDGHISLPPEKGHHHGMIILELLAKIKPSSGNAGISSYLYKTGFTLPWRSRIYYIGPPPGMEELFKLEAFRNKGMFPEFIMVPRENKTEEN